MTRTTSTSALLFSATLVAALLSLAAALPPTPAVRAEARPAAFNHRTAAAYLDQREQWWQHWAPAQKEQGTVCISCHTTIP